MRERTRISLVAVGVVAVTSLGASPSTADPFGDNHGAVHRGVESSTNLSLVTNADGLWAKAVTVSDMDVPRSSGTPGTSLSAGVTAVGHNTRPIQLLATAPPAAVNGGEFFATGYTAGCGAQGLGPTGCTGTTSTGGVYKRPYVDGTFCNYSDNICRYGYWQYDPISAGTTVQYQLQRNVINGTSTWRAWVNGSLVHTRTSLLMTHARMSLGAESATNIGVTPQSLNMTQSNFNDVRFHRNGAASSSPPGTTNYTTLSWTSLSQPHAPACGAARQTATAGGVSYITGLTTSGRC